MRSLGCSIAASALVLGGLTLLVARRKTGRVDRAIANRIGASERTAERLSRVALPRTIAIEGVLLSLLPGLHRHERHALAGATLLVSVGGTALKRLIRRDRPAKTRFDARGDQSFPSTHAAHATALGLAAATVAHRFSSRIAADLVAFGFGSVIGWARIRAGAHWPTDVAAGIALGALSAYTARALAGAI